MLNDVIFANHGIILSYIIFSQFFFYARDPRERLSLPARVINVAIGAALLIQIILCLAGAETWLTLTQAMGIIRVGIVIVQVLPQILKHYKEKRTDGWSIWGIFLDIIGSIFSFLQQFIDAIAVQNWAVAFGSPAKILLALVILILDSVFIIQHYVLYRNPTPIAVHYDKLSEEEETVQSPSNEDLDIQL
jgi:cystinosin